MMAGDFNCIMGPMRKGDKPYVNKVEFKEFQSFMIMNGLIDLGYFGSIFTWYNN